MTKVLVQLGDIEAGYLAGFEGGAFVTYRIQSGQGGKALRSN
ncbi:hypothetical protein Q2941_12215 [Bradyrhizobium sp. UFLA05-153]